MILETTTWSKKVMHISQKAISEALHKILELSNIYLQTVCKLPLNPSFTKTVAVGAG